MNVVSPILYLFDIFIFIYIFITYLLFRFLINQLQYVGFFFWFTWTEMGQEKVNM